MISISSKKVIEKACAMLTSVASSSIGKSRETVSELLPEEQESNSMLRVRMRAFNLESPFLEKYKDSLLSKTSPIAVKNLIL